MQPFVVGIAGGSGSGKTTFAQNIASAFPYCATLLAHDYYYVPFAEFSLEERKQQNFDHPSSFDTVLMSAQLKLLKQGLPIQRPVYSYTQFTRMPQTETVQPTALIIVEGLLVLENAELRNSFDLKLFIDTDADVRFIRRLTRDMKTRGRSVDSVITQYLSTVKPMHEQFIEPSKRYADLIVPHGGQNQVALTTVLQMIKTHIE